MEKRTDVVNEIAVRNHRMYLNKLDMDLDSNYELLKIITSNFINTSLLEVVSGVLNIEEGFINKKYIKEKVDSFFGDLEEYVFLLYKERLVLLKRKKDNNNYLNYINDSLINLICEYYRLQVNNLINSLSLNYDEFKKGRLVYYLMDSYYRRFLFKISEIIDNTNLILVNNYHESKKRYHLINENTLTKCDI